MAAVAIAAAAPFPPKPKLVVLIAIDQFRYDYLTHYASEFHGGYDRLLTGGAVFANANLAHYPSVTAVGHATMLTGATPAVSGIVGNEWYDRGSGKAVTSVSDPAERLLGGADAEGSSPRRLLVSTLGDEMKLANPDCRVIGISIKDRSAILTSGHLADAAYWFDLKTARFASSTYYFQNLPAWVKAFNDSGTIDAYQGREWSFPGGRASMPSEPLAKFANALYFSPFGNELVERFAERAIDAEKLGRRGTTDLLTVSFSSIDAVGHETGPASPKLHDLIVQSDRVLARLLDYLDRAVGLANAVVIFTSDHGVAEMPSLVKMSGGRILDADLLATAQSALERKYGSGQWVAKVFDGAVYLNTALMEGGKFPEAEAQEIAAEALRRIPHVFRIYTRTQLLRGQTPQDRISRIVSASLNWTRTADLQVLLDPSWVRAKTNTGHDTPFSYDTQIPLIFLGTAVKSGLYYKNVELNDLAPTLATMLSVATPSGSSGRVLHEMLKPAVSEPAPAHASSPR